MKKSRINSTILNTSMGMLVKSLNVIINFVMRTVFIGSLGNEYNGVSSLFTDILMVLSFAELGIASAITFELYKPLAEEDELHIAKLMNFLKKAYRIVAFTIFAVGLCFIPFMKKVIIDVPGIKESIYLIYILYLMNTSVSYLQIYKSTLLIAAQRKYLVSGIEIIMTMIRVLLQCAVLLILKNYIGYLIIMILFTLSQNMIISIQVDKIYPFLNRYNKQLEEKEIQKIFKDIKALSLYKIAGAVLSGTDSVIISSLVGTVQVGLVANYKLVIAGVDGILQQFYSAVEPSIGNLAVEEDSKRQFQIFKITQFLTFWISCFGSISFVVLLNPFINIWLGEAYVLSKDIVVAMVLNFYVTMMMRSVASFRTANGLFVHGQYRPAVMAVLNIVLSAILGIRWKVFGILIATVLSRLLTQAWFDPLLLYRNVFREPFFNYVKQYIEYAIVTIVGYLIIERISSFVIISNIFWDFTMKFFMIVLLLNLLLILIYAKSMEFREVMVILKHLWGKVAVGKEK